MDIDREKLYDVIVIGGGPAGLTAALYLARACYRVLVVEKEHFGGQITITSEVVNYPGVKHTDGKTLTENMRAQAESFGAEFLLAEVTQLSLEGDLKTVVTSSGSYTCFGVLIATGAHPRTVGFKGEDLWKGHGVAYCATCDGEFFTGKELFIVGGGFAAAEESVFLTKYASHINILVREDDFTCAKATADLAKNHPKITVLTNTVIDSVDGDNAITTVEYHNTKTGEKTKRSANNGDNFGIFVFAGYAPATELVDKKLECNQQGYIITDRNQKTNLEGVYAAGDVCVKSLRQVVTAVGDGATAATELEKYAQSMSEKTGLKPQYTPPAKAVQAEQADNTTLAKADGELFSADILAQLDSVFSKMENPVILKLYLNDTPVSAQLQEYMDAIAERTDKISVIKETSSESTPYVSILRQNGDDTGMAFHGVPGGHEFTSFIIGIYNVSGTGQKLEEPVLQKIKQISEQKDLKILVSLSCTMCPQLVMAAQKIAAENSLVTAHAYDINYFPQLKEKYNVMSVPCLVVNNSKVFFGKKNLQQLLDII
ncbi:FAD-dependent oxidoreductase [Oscillospiraceae bacterium LCP25S3_F9]|nr:FAD-dependent oxidoreductase [Oscillospiraceae bacterium]